MTHSTPEQNELYRFKEIAFDVAQIYGVTTDQGLVRAKRALNRAMLSLAGNDRRWTWLKTVDSFNTVADTMEYSLPNVKQIHQMWVEETSRQYLDEITDSAFTKAVPNRSESTGNPRYFREEGVDSNGHKNFGLYPVPSSELEVFYRYTRHIQEIRNEELDVRSEWGLPPNLLEALINKAAALCSQGSNQKKYMELNAVAEAQIEEAYAADQARPGKIFRAPMQGSRRSDDGPQLPATYSDNGL